MLPILQKAQTVDNMDMTSCHVRPFLEDVHVQCRTQYDPHCETSIDEAMVAYTGRLSIKQYLPLKPTKRWIKIWAQADPHNGFLNDFQVYTGRANNKVETGLGERSDKRYIWGKNHHVYCDNYFSSVPLFEELLENKTYACVTVRTNRKYLPAGVTQAKLKCQGEMVVLQKEGSMMAVAWHDK
ncbi:piggyBac transposable element-derived protein 4-like [Gigantopelta aegis]|uniref:piggyBac transposable element-derived protein 4-like n=1 Tax=Gigantopelta aegis TaxID=1735272 RepID=UPI001B889A03|nr:piggyBac transposable element-derived protein 4-like [Gigantopelta aegis]